MHQFDLILKDFVNWKMDNIHIIERFKMNHSSIYDRFEPVYAVLNHIYEQAVENVALDEEYETIFQVGLNYLHNQFEIIKIYFEKLFNSDCETFETFTPIVNYLLMIDDFRTDLEELEEDIDFEELNEVETMLENMIAEKRHEFDYAAERLKSTLDKIIDELEFEYVSIVDIFYEIAVKLDVTLTEGETFEVGTEI